MSTLIFTDSVSLVVALRRFALHFIEMCVVMCAGGLALDAGVFAVWGALGHPDLVADAPAVAIILIALDAAIAMAVYMQLRRHPVRHNLEMSGSTIVGGIALVGALGIGLIPAAKLATWLGLATFMCGPLCLLMLVVMAVRFEHYGGRVGRVLAGATGDYRCSMHPEVRRPGPGTCPLCGMTLVPVS